MVLLPVTIGGVGRYLQYWFALIMRPPLLQNNVLVLDCSVCAACQCGCPVGAHRVGLRVLASMGGSWQGVMSKLISCALHQVSQTESSILLLLVCFELPEFVL